MAAWRRDLLEQAREAAQPGEDARLRRLLRATTALAGVGLAAGVVASVTDVAWLEPLMQHQPVATVVVAALALVSGVGWGLRAASKSLHPRFELHEVAPARERLEYAEGAVRVARRERDAVLAALTHARGQLVADGGGLALAGTDGGELAVAAEGGLSEVD